MMSILPRAPDSLPSQRVLQGYFFVQKYSFAAIGIDPTSLKRTIYNPYRAWIPLLSIVTVCIPVFLYASKYVDDLLQMTNILAPIWQSLLGIIKFFLFMWNRKKIVELVRKLWQRNLEANDEELKILVEENSYDTKISIFYYTSVFISAVLATLLPFMTAGFYAWKGYSFWESLDPPFKGVYLVDPHNSYWAYAFAFIWNALGIYYVLNGTLAIDTLFSWFMRNISAQFRILNLKFELIAKDVASMKTQNLELDRCIIEAISRCVDYHRRTIQLAESFNEVYKHIVLIKFLISCVQIALVTFQFPNTTQVAVQMFNVSFMVSVSTQLMLYCHGGQKIKELSSSVDLTIYESFQWDGLPIKIQNLLRLIMVRSQKSCHLTGFFFVLDLSLFVWVFKSAGSFLAMMLSLSESEIQ